MRFVKNFLLKLGSYLRWLLKGFWNILNWVLFKPLKWVAVSLWRWLNWTFRSESSLMHNNIKNLPTSKWWEINETRDYTLLLKNTTVVTRRIHNKCTAVFESIEQQHIDKFNHSKEFIDYWNDLYRLYKKKIKASVNGGSDESHYEFAQIRFDAMYKGKKMNNYKLKGSVERILNLSYRIDPDVMPIIEFSTLVESAKETTQDARN